MGKLLTMNKRQAKPGRMNCRRKPLGQALPAAVQAVDEMMNSCGRGT